MHFDHGDFGALCGKELGYGFADISSGSGDDRHLSWQLHVFSSFLTCVW
jgi:hypothetical protein